MSEPQNRQDDPVCPACQQRVRAGFKVAVGALTYHERCYAAALLGLAPL